MANSAGVIPLAEDTNPKTVSKMTRVGNQTNSTDPHSVNSRIFVGNLNTYVVSKEDVERIFTRYGKVIGISMHKGYAFVQFTDSWDARNSVVGEDGRTVAGQVLDVNMVSEPKPHQVNRKRQILGTSGNTFLGVRQAVPPLKRQRTDILGFPLTPRPKTKPPKLTDKQQASLNSLYSNGEPDILICGNCKEIFPGIHKLIEHKKQTCKLRFTCRCQFTTSPPGAPARPICARCQSKQSSWWDLVQHVQTAHGSAIYQWDEASSNSVDSPLGDDPLQSQSGDMNSYSSTAQDLKDESCCSDSQSGMPDWDSLEVNNGAVEEECDEIDQRMRAIEDMNHHTLEDKAVDTADLGLPAGQG